MVPAGADKMWAEDSGGTGTVLLLLHEGVADARIAAAGRISGCELVRIPGVDHYPTSRARELVTETIPRHCAS
jgi:hypothetical protein